jgi:thymidylate kinase
MSDEVRQLPRSEPDRDEASSSASADADWAPAFIRLLVRELELAGVRWCVLRNPDDLPDRVGHDVDVLVHPADEARAVEVVRDAVARSDLFLVRTYRGVEHLGIDVAASDLSGRRFLHLDLQTALRYRGRLLIDAEDLLAHRAARDGIWSPTAGMEAYALLLHAALHKRELKEKYAERLRVLIDAAPGELERLATVRLGRRLGEQLAAVRAQEDLLALRSRLAGAVDRRSPSNRWRRPWFVVRSGLAMTRLRLRPRGVFVVLLGPDGSGKSSTTDLLVRELDDPSSVIPVRRVYLGSGTPLLPTRRIMRRIHKRTGKKPSGPTPLRDVRPRRLKGAIHVMADEIVRYWVQVRPKLAPHGIVVSDRYAYDVLRVNNGVIRRPWFRRLVTTLVPEPDITFYLEGDPEVVAARKQELTVAETIRQQEVYRGLGGLLRSFRPIDLSVRDRAAMRDLALQVLDAFARRNGGEARG